MERIAILAINPVYAKSIYRRRMTFIVRKCRIKTSRVYLYETTPVKRVTGIIEIGEPVKLPIDNIKANFTKETNLTPEDIDLYAKGREELWLWPIKEVSQILPFKYYNPTLHSFIYA